MGSVLIRSSLLLLDGFAQDQTAPGSWVVSSRTLILFALIVGISATKDKLTAKDSASQQSSKPTIANDLSLFLKSWQEEFCAFPHYGPLSSSCALIFRSGPDAVQCPAPPRVLTQKGVCSHTKSGVPEGAVRGLEVPLKRSRPPKDDARRMKKSRPTSVVSGKPPSRDWSVGGRQVGGGLVQ
ncbi:hypothetical protein E2C01_044757 [Portunus trituberculatus]|uniref:Uncharacterized protein n=1 Tax=Portunus trituberculatus TaxID=210409 RepID=A0A5B7G358_PORTR|nr:hypothetical protein [Portunus trituberculatus]